MQYKLHMVPCRGRGGRCKRKDLLNEILRKTGNYRKVLKFRSRRERLSYLIQWFTPFAHKITPSDKHSITHWLRSNFVPEEDIEVFYDAVTKT